MNLKSQSTISLACQREEGVFSAEQKERHQAIWKQLRKAAEGSQHLPNGYAFRFPAKDSLILSLAEFATLERLCCPFFHFRIEIEPDAGPLWLQLTGPAGIEDLFESELEPDRD